MTQKNCIFHNKSTKPSKIQMCVWCANINLQLNAETSSYSTSTNTFLKFILKDPVSEGKLWNILFQDTPVPRGETTGKS